MALLESVGGAVVKAPTESAFGGIYNAHVRDPNGVVWEIAHNPAWSVARRRDRVAGLRLVLPGAAPIWSARAPGDVRLTKFGRKVERRGVEQLGSSLGS